MVHNNATGIPRGQGVNWLALLLLLCCLQAKLSEAQKRCNQDFIEVIDKICSRTPHGYMSKRMEAVAAPTLPKLLSPLSPYQPLIRTRRHASRFPDECCYTKCSISELIAYCRS